MVSTGSSKSKGASSSKTVFPEQFFEEAFDFFGQPPEFKPQFVAGLDPDTIEKALFERSLQKLNPEFETARARTREELSQSGLLNSPVVNIKGGALDQLERNFENAKQAAATEAAIAGQQFRGQEAGRQTEFNVDTAKTLLNYFLQLLGVATTAGRKGSSTQSGSSTQIGIL